MTMTSGFIYAFMQVLSMLCCIVQEHIWDTQTDRQTDKFSFIVKMMSQS